jgi:hypothetical protein
VFEGSDYEDALNLYMSHQEKIRARERLITLQREQMKIQSEKYHSFPLKSFGIFNVDLIKNEKHTAFLPRWNDELGNSLESGIFYFMLYHDLNSYVGVIDSVHFFSQGKHSIVGVKGDSTYYCTINDLTSPFINLNKNYFAPKMTLYTDKITDKETLLVLLDR